MGIGAFLGAVAPSLVSGFLGKKSGDKQAGISQAQYDQTRKDLEPYRAAGTNALSTYQDQIGGYNQNLPQYGAADYTPGGEFNFDLQADQGFNFARDQAMQATTRQHAAQGGFNSGNVLTALSDRATGMASQYADQAFNRQMGQSRENFGRGLTDYGIRQDRAAQDYNIASGQERDLYGRDQNYLNRLQNLAGSGQSAAVQTGGFGAQNVGAQIGAEQFGTGSINNAIQGGMSNYLIGNYLNQQPYMTSGYTDNRGYGVG